MVTALLLIPLAYLLGTFPSAALVARAEGRDITQEGSGNPGASNAFRILGWKWGLVVLFLDMGKGALAAGVGLALAGHAGAYVLGTAAILGHVFPATRRFRGGRGVATGGGVLVVVFPLAIAGLAILWVAVARGLHKASIASIVCSVAFPVFVVLDHGSVLDISVSVGIALIVLGRHLTNVRRLVQGQEPGLDIPDPPGSPGTAG